MTRDILAFSGHDLMGAGQMAVDIGRRQFISVLSGATVAWPLAGRAQQPAMPVIGLLSSGTPEPNAALLEAFRKGLRTTGLIENQNCLIEYRWAKGDYAQLPALAGELVRRPVNVFVAFDNTATALAAKTATTKIPIVFAIGTDPVRFGLVPSLSRPGGNVTGVAALTVGLGVKRLQVLQELLPNATTIAILVNPRNPAAESETADILEEAKASGRAITILQASTSSEIDAAFGSAADQKVAGVLIVSEPFLSTRREQMAALAAKHSLPAIDAYREFVQAGGLMSYGASQEETRRIAGIYAGRILKGDKPADLPVQMSTKIELLLNLKSARKLGVSFPTSLLVRADEVIE